jgi:hypothetical protein
VEEEVTDARGSQHCFLFAKEEDVRSGSTETRM